MKDISSLLLSSLLFFTLGSLLLDGFLDDTDSNGLLHVSDGESSEWWELREGLDDHWLGWGKLDDGSISRLDEFGELFSDLTSSLVHLVLDLGELAGNMASVAIKDWRVTVHDLTWMVHDDNLSLEELGVHGWDVLGIRGDVSSLDVSDGETLDVETNVVSWDGLSDLLVMHLDGLDISGGSERTEGASHVWLDDTSLDSTDWHSSDTRDLVDILEWESEWLEDWSLWWLDGIEGLEEVWTLVPWHVVGVLQHVVTNPTGDWDEWNSVDLVSDLLEVLGDLRLDFFISLFLVVGTLGVHLVAADDHLLDTHGESKKSVLSGLTFLGPSRLELTRWRGNHKNGDIGLGGTGDHVLDEVSVSWSINDGEDGGLRLELPESDINGDTSFSLGLELIEHPGVLERSLTHFFSFLLELLDGSLIDTTALVDQVTSGGGFTGVDMTNDDEVDVLLFFTHWIRVFVLFNNDYFKSKPAYKLFADNWKHCLLTTNDYNILRSENKPNLFTVY